MGLSLNIQVLRGGQAVGQHQFDSDTHRTIKIGRLTTAQVKLEDPKVSRIHAVIEFAGVDASLIDMGSTQGTAVNGAKVSKVKLNHGDQIVVGDTTLVMGFGSAAGQVAVAAPASAAPATPASVSASAVAGVPRAAPVPAAPPAAASPTEGAVVEAEGRAAPTFDPGQLDDPSRQMRRLTPDRLRAATADGPPHPGIVAEETLTRDNRLLELRFYWGEVMLGMFHYDKPKRVTIGENTSTSIFLSSEGLPREDFPLVRYQDGEYLLAYTGQMEGQLEAAGKVVSLREAEGGLGKRDEGLANTFVVKMADDMRALLHWGGATFAMRFVPPPKVTKAPFGRDIDLSFINSSAASLLLHVVFVIALAVYPHDTEALKVDLFGEPDRFASLILEAPKENTSTKDMLEKIKKQVEEKKEQIQEPDKKDKAKPLEAKNVVPKNIPRPQKTAEEKKAEVAKRFSKLFGGGSAGSLLGGGGGGSLSGTLQNVIGTAGAGSASAGMAGLGIRGSGPLTGGGVGVSRGIAGIGTTGRLGGGGLAYGSGVGLGSARQRNMIDLETPQIEGALPPDVIKKVINENKNQVRYCYEVELQRNQNLEGRVVVKWIIGATGSVVQVSIKETSIKNPSVESCLMGKIRNWKFPPPAGGGTVEVNYPFVFKAS